MNQNLFPFLDSWQPIRFFKAYYEPIQIVGRFKASTSTAEARWNWLSRGGAFRYGRWARNLRDGFAHENMFVETQNQGHFTYFWKPWVGSNYTHGKGVCFKIRMPEGTLVCV